MQYLLHFFQTFKSWSGMVDAVATLLGLIQTWGWMTDIGALFGLGSIGAFVYARHQRQHLDATSVEIEGISIDSVNAANLRRRVNRSLAIQTADHIATIDGGDLDMVWRYAGYCRAERETAMEFSVDSENSIPFSRLDCFAYDLKLDPEKKCKIQPVLIGPDSISKKIAVPFLEPIVAEQPFDIMLHCRMPATYKLGLCYYTSTLSFDQEKVGRCTVQLTFVGQKPDWVRVYECDPSGRPRLLKTLRPVREGRERSEYRDEAKDVKAQSARIYLFHRADM
jgi:hypothetical protein